MRKEIEQRRAELETLRDEIRVRMHLAGMEAKERWSKLEPRIDAFEQRARHATDEALHELRDMANDLKQRVHRLRQDVQQKSSDE